MNAEQLSILLSDYECLKKVSIRIIDINNLPSFVTGQYPQLFIINPGKHWVCIIFYSPSKAEYFDSLGKPVEFYGSNLSKFIDDNSSNCTFIQRQLQSNISNVCGLYVVFFALMRLCCKMSMKQVYDMFTENVHENDQLVKLYVLHVYL